MPEREIDLHTRRVRDDARAASLGGIDPSLDVSPFVALVLEQIVLRAALALADKLDWTPLWPLTETATSTALQTIITLTLSFLVFTFGSILVAIQVASGQLTPRIIATALLREIWRVLAPSGQLLAVVPNRRGLWARMDTTPFGHGRPYSRSQITELLRQTWFTPTGWGEALFVPPVAGSWFLRSAMAWEQVGAALSLPLAGVHIVEATKQVYRAIPAHRERTRLIPALRPVLVPSSLKG